MKRIMKSCGFFNEFFATDDWYYRSNQIDDGTISRRDYLIVERDSYTPLYWIFLPLQRIRMDFYE